MNDVIDVIVIVILAIIVIAITSALFYVLFAFLKSLEQNIQFYDSIPTCHPDIVILGGGTAGCVLARRLADEHPNKIIMVLERGNDLRHDRNVYRSENAINIAYTPPYSQVIVPDYPGVVCGIASMYGGGSSHNFGLVVQGTSQLYSSQWLPKLNITECELNKCIDRIYSTIDVFEIPPSINPISKIPSLIQMGLTQGLTPIKEGIDVFLHLGPLRADDTLSSNMMEGMRQQFPDVPIVDDYNAVGVVNAVCSAQRLYINPVNAVRASANCQYLPDGYHSKNLYLVRQATIDRIDPDTLDVHVNGCKIRAKEKTILCMGGILSPYILLKSGFNVTGNGLVNHYGTQAIFAIKGIKDFSSGPLAFLPGIGDDNKRKWQIITSGSTLTDMKLLQRQGVNTTQLTADGYTFITFLLFLLYPKSRGKVYVKGDGTPGVDLNLFNDTDNSSLVEGMRYLYSNYLYLKTQYDINPAFPPADVWERNNSAELLEVVKTGVIISDHYSCILSNQVNANFQVNGYPNLHVVDASTFPCITDGNTQFPAMLIGEIASNIIFRSPQIVQQIVE